MPAEGSNAKKRGLCAFALCALGPAVVALVLSGLSLGCASSQFDGKTYRDKDVAFALGPIPAGAEELSAKGEAKLAFHDPRTGATMSVQAQCGMDAEDAPLRALAAHLFLQMGEREIIVDKELTLDHRAALEMELQAELDGVRRHFVILVLRKDACVYDLLHVDAGGDDPRLVESRAAFRKMAYGFHTVK